VIFSVDCAGKPLVNAPDWTINLAYEHRFALADGASLTLGADTRIQTAAGSLHHQQCPAAV
jgi:iron complex outermembrane recepter protein